MQPRFSCRVIVPGLDRLVMNVGEITTEPVDLLDQARLCPVHEVGKAATPHLVIADESARDAIAVSFDCVYPHLLRGEGGQLTMPEQPLCIVY